MSQHIAVHQYNLKLKKLLRRLKNWTEERNKKEEEKNTRKKDNKLHNHDVTIYWEEQFFLPKK